MNAVMVAPATEPRRVVRRRRSGVTVALALLVLLLVGISLAWHVGLTEVVGHLQSLTGLGGERSFVVRLRLPRVAMAVAVGTAFGLAGALFQTVLRNPLASPDIIGITGGASMAGAWAILVVGLSGIWVSAVALAGAVLVAGTILVLSWTSELSGYRFVLVGVGLAFLCQAGIGYLLTRAEEGTLGSALVWMVGSIGTPRWPAVAGLALTLVVLIPLAAFGAWRLRVLQLGDDLAGGLGVHPSRARLLVLLTGTALAALATAAVGPVAFVAFMAGPIARRLVADGGPALAASALVGSVVVLAGELVSEQLLSSIEIPVGIVTGVIGAPYLLWLLATDRRSRG